MEKLTYTAIEDNREIDCHIFIKKDFISPEKCELLIRYYNDTDQEIKAKYIDFFNDRVIWYTRIAESSFAKGIMREARLNTIKFIKECYSLQNEIYGDSIQLVSWPEGLGMPQHYDNRHPDKHEHHETPWRQYAGVIYLNDNFDGGELIMSSANPSIIIKPKQGMLVIFGGGNGYMHGVSPAIGNTRYTMPCWFTEDLTKKESEISFI